jgi:CRISPR system Cascade subunit CasE
MYLSRLILNPRSRQVQNEIANPYEMHRTVMSAFPETLPPHERVLFRLEQPPDLGWPVLLVQSQTCPNWEVLPAHYLLDGHALPPDEHNPAVKQVALVLNVGQRLRFRLLANPTVKRNGKRHGLCRAEEQYAWLQRKLESAGAQLLDVHIRPDKRITGRTAHHRGAHTLRFLAVQFDGLMEVTSPELLLDAVHKGIGSGKGLGFGLLSLAPAR